MKYAILSLGLLVAAGSARADEEKVALKDVPKAVLAAVKEKFPEGKPTKAVKEEAEGKAIYEIVVEDDDETIDVSVSPKGEILEAETAISAKKLPKKVAAAIEAKYPKAKIEKAEKVIKYGKKKEKTTYEVVMAAEGKESFEVKLSAKGKILDGEEEEEDEADEKKAKSKKDKDGDEKKAKSKKDKDEDDEDDEKKVKSKKDKDEDDEDDDDDDDDMEAKGKKKGKD